MWCVSLPVEGLRLVLCSRRHFAAMSSSRPSNRYRSRSRTRPGAGAEDERLRDMRQVQLDKETLIEAKRAERKRLGGASSVQRLRHAQQDAANWICSVVNITENAVDAIACRELVEKFVALTRDCAPVGQEAMNEVSADQREEICSSRYEEGVYMNFTSVPSGSLPDWHKPHFVQ